MRLDRTSAGTGRRLAYCVCIVAAWAAPAWADDFAVTGEASFNGHAAMIDDGLFLGSSYAQASGAVAPGTFKIVGANVGDGTLALTIDIGQANTSGGAVAATGAAALSDALLSLTVTSATYNGAPIVVGSDCVFTPVHVALAGYGRGDGLGLSASGFDVPALGGDACNGFASAIDAVLAGSDDAVALRVEGDFAPPGTIFTAGFEQVR